MKPVVGLCPPSAIPHHTAKTLKEQAFDIVMDAMNQIEDITEYQEERPIWLKRILGTMYVDLLALNRKASNETDIKINGITSNLG